MQRKIHNLQEKSETNKSKQLGCVKWKNEWTNSIQWEGNSNKD